MRISESQSYTGNRRSLFLLTEHISVTVAFGLHFYVSLP